MCKCRHPPVTFRRQLTGLPSTHQWLHRCSKSEQPIMGATIDEMDRSLSSSCRPPQVLFRSCKQLLVTDVGCQGPIGLTCFFREVLRKTGRQSSPKVPVIKAEIGMIAPHSSHGVEVQNSIMSQFVPGLVDHLVRRTWKSPVAFTIQKIKELLFHIFFLPNATSMLIVQLIFC